MNDIEIQDLAYNNRDKVVSVLKSAIGTIPYAGPIAQELLGAIIPGQRLDRVVTFIKKLSDDFLKLQDTVDEFIDKLHNPEYSSLFYKACQFSADALSEERIEYIKNIFMKGLEKSDQDLIRHESLMNLLSKLNDIELVYLRIYYLFKWDLEAAREYQEKTGMNFLLPSIHGGLSEEERDREVAKDIYLNNLISLGLLEIEYDKRNGKPRNKCSRVGDLLIKTLQE